MADATAESSALGDQEAPSDRDALLGRRLGELVSGPFRKEELDTDRPELRLHARDAVDGSQVMYYAPTTALACDWDWALRIQPIGFEVSSTGEVRPRKILYFELKETGEGLVVYDKSSDAGPAVAVREAPLERLVELLASAK